MSGTTQLITRLAVAADLTLNETLRLRLCDIDFKKNFILVRKINGRKKFTATIPVDLILDLRIQTIKVRRLTQQEKIQEVGDRNPELSALTGQLEPEQQYLFPDSNRNKPNLRTKLSKIPLALLKNDIQLAIKSYTRFLPEKDLSKKKLSNKNIRFVAANKKQLSQDGQQKNKVFSGHTQYQRQSSFSFSNNLSTL